MRASVILISLATLAVVIGGALGINWFIQASQSKKAVERALAAVNEKQPYITYESIETSGFPTQVWISIVRPHFTGNVSALMKAGIAEMPDGPLKTSRMQKFQAMPEWNEDITLDGMITLGVNALSNRYSLRVQGDWKSHSRIGTQTINAITKMNGDMSCMLELERGSGVFGSLWSFKPLSEQEWIESFRQVDCSFPAYSMNDESAGTVLASSQGGRVYATNQQSGAVHNIRFYAKSTDVEVTPAGDTVMEAYIGALAPAFPISSKWSSYGKQNAEIDFSYSGPLAWDATTKNQPFDMRLGRFAITNRIYNSTASFQLASTLQEGQRQGKFILQSNTECSEAYDTLMKQTVRGLIVEAAADSDPKLSVIHTALRHYTPDQVFSIVEPAIPKFHPLGKMVLAADAGFTGKEDFSAGDTAIRTIEISATPYGITGNGTISTQPGRPFPAANVTLNCRQCLLLVDDVFAFIGRVQTALDTLSPEESANHHPFDPKLQEGIKGFLQVIGAPSAEAGTFTYAIFSDGAGMVGINDKRIDEVMTLYNQYVAPFLKANHPAPPAD